MESRIEISWVCHPCDVQGQDAQKGRRAPRCWNCDGPVVVTARPTVRGSTGPGTG